MYMVIESLVSRVIYVSGLWRLVGISSLDVVNTCFQVA